MSSGSRGRADLPSPYLPAACGDLDQPPFLGHAVSCGDAPFPGENVYWFRMLWELVLLAFCGRARYAVFLSARVHMSVASLLQTLVWKYGL